jgi:hypothetical protein
LKREGPNQPKKPNLAIEKKDKKIGRKKRKKGMENKGKKGKQATIALLEFFHQQVLYHYMCLAKTKPMLKKKTIIKG